MNCLLSIFRRLPLALVLLASCSGPAQVNYQPGHSYFGRGNYIEYIAGDMPVIFSAPHGGTLNPAEIPNRTQGTFTYDEHTEELARAVQRVFHDYFGHYPHVIICRLERVKVDCNRELDLGAGPNPKAQQAWKEFQRFIEIARGNVLARTGKGFYIDLHGQNHPIKRLELGYGLTSAQLANPDAILNQPQYAERSTLRALARQTGLPFAELLRGSNSFGGRLLAKGYPAVPSPAMPYPGAGNRYFDGGYNVTRHTSLRGGAIDGLQIESNLAGVRDTAINRTNFSLALAQTVEFFFTNYYQLDLHAQPHAAEPAR